MQDRFQLGPAVEDAQPGLCYLPSILSSVLTLAFSDVVRKVDYIPHTLVKIFLLAVVL